MNTFETGKSKTNGNGSKKAATATKTGGNELDRRALLGALRAFKRGDFTTRLRDDLTGVDGQIAETFNELVDMVKMIREEAGEV